VDPYRSKPSSDAEEHGSRLQGGEVAWELAPPFAVLWIASLARVLYVFMHAQTFGVQDTLALGALFLLPWLLVARGRVTGR
jgi:hypothetical protein